MTQPADFGAELQRARLAQGRSLADCAAGLNMTRGRLELVEAGDWEALGPLVFSRNFVARYASLLAVDFQPAEHWFEDRRAAEQERQSRRCSRQTERQRAARRRFVIRYAAAIAVAILVAIPLISGLRYMFGTRAPEAGSGDVVMASAGRLAQARRMPAAKPGQVAVFRGRTLSIQTLDSTWLEVRSASGERLLHGEHEAGGEWSLVLNEPVSVSLDNAPAVRLWLDGTPLSLTTQGQSARFDILQSE